MHLLLYHLLLLFIYIFDSYLIYAYQSPNTWQVPYTEIQPNVMKYSNSDSPISSDDNMKSEGKLYSNNSMKVTEKNTTQSKNDKVSNTEVLGFSEGSLGVQKNITSDKYNEGVTGKQLNGNLGGSDIEVKSVAKGSVVARKGAPGLPESTSTLNNSDINTSPQEKQDNQKTTIGNSKSIENKLSTNTTQSGIKKKPEIINKKPESASDFTAEEADRFSFIESSATGKDYVMTGIAIFVCIWAVIFGALFFYKRAGELWDRRHYRRMDFLVEGMYND